MKRLQIVLLVVATLSLFLSCKKEKVDPVASGEIGALEDFVWSGLNSWYLWQEDQTLLNDKYKTDKKSLGELANKYSNIEAWFEGLLYQYQTVDRFSWIVDDYTKLEQQFQGITESFGFRYGLLKAASYGYTGVGPNDVLGYVRYVSPNSPASRAGLKRGDIIYGVNGTKITISNYADLLFNKKEISYDLATITGKNVSPNGKKASLVAEQINENPVLMTKTFDLNGKKVGYLAYNGFVHTYHKELNEAFSKLKAEGVQDMVLDLRYNGGGSIYTAMHLGSMLYQNDESKVFGKIQYNNKHRDNNSDLPFLKEVNVLDGEFKSVSTEPLNSLNLSKLYILVSGSTASASEMIINGLAPYMEVKLIGTNTVGKNVGSVTLYDSPSSDYRDKKTANTSHKYAMQPLVSEIVNSQNKGDYIHGFKPDIEINELQYLADLYPLGDPKEIMLSAALKDICPTCEEITGPNSSRAKAFIAEDIIADSETPLMTKNRMYLNGIK